MESRTTGARPHTRTTHRPGDSSGSSARDHYLREKARRDQQDRPENELLAAAKREYLALLEADAAKGKGGRPKKKVGRPAAKKADDLFDDESDASPVGDANQGDEADDADEADEADEGSEEEEAEEE